MNLSCPSCHSWWLLFFLLGVCGVVSSLKGLQAPGRIFSAALPSSCSCSNVNPAPSLPFPPEQVPSSHRGEKWLGRGHQVGMTRLRQLTCTSLNSIRYQQALILLGKANKALPWGQRAPGAGGSWRCHIYCGGDRQPGEGDRAVSWSAGH